ncbi:MAG: ORF6N domain-containing protein [Acetobacter papayae]|uniref:ORF6N domain-containing protein n=1 Tax=Acetobacter papayae TaxID=1076592 RepID=UPI0039ED3ECD
MTEYSNPGANSTHTVKQECSAQPGNQIAINDCNVTVVEYAGQRVITFKMVDELHGRAEGTARKRFNDNKGRLSDGEDYFVRNSDEAKVMGFTAPNGLILLTESGYLMLVKSFTDDLAWQVQKELVKGYFRAKEIISQKKEIDRIAMLRKAIALHGSALAFNKRQGMDLTQARLKAVATVKEQMGIDLPEELGWQAQPLAIQQRTVNATEIGRALGMKNTEVNQLLESQGYHTGLRDMKLRRVWKPTNKGMKFGRYEDKAKKHSEGTVQPWVWFENIVDELRPFAPTPAHTA